MEILFILIIISLVITSGFLLSFLWAVKKGQYEDFYSPAVRILFDDEVKNNNKTATHK
jgi:cbb3-type cytochrome oxidase maturation protein